MIIPIRSVCPSAGATRAPQTRLDEREQLDRRAALHERIGPKLDAERRRCRLGFLSLMQSTHGGAYPHLAYLQSCTHGDAYPHLAYLQSGTHGDAYPHLAYLREWHVDLQCA